MCLTFRETCAVEVLQLLLKIDLKESVSSQMGREWVVEQAFKIADLMEKKNNE